jgi:predicted secreted protein
MVSISAPLALPDMSVAQYLWELETASSEVIVEDEDRLAPSLA